jgi:putative lipase involved disintegration of autophagic bodies
MVTQLEYAAFAENAYTPGDQNRINVDGWTRDLDFNGADRGNGFDASVFAKDDGSEVVVSFRGTDFEATLSGLADWTAGNVPAAFGKPSPQVLRAIEFLADVLAKPEYQGKHVTLTGHSLGGGLASLMAVFFNLDATVFAPAPFEASALDYRIVSAVPPMTVLPTKQVEEYIKHYVGYQFERDRPWSTAMPCVPYGNGYSPVFSRLGRSRPLYGVIASPSRCGF